jgi:hypothetical protein
MTILDEFMLNSAESILAERGEAMTFRPKSGSPRTIWGVVDRQQVASIPGYSGGNSPYGAIAVKNSASGSFPGITSAEIDTGGDMIDYQIRLGETAQSRRVARIISQDPGMMVVEML